MKRVRSKFCAALLILVAACACLADLNQAVRLWLGYPFIAVYGDSIPISSGIDGAARITSASGGVVTGTNLAVSGYTYAQVYASEVLGSLGTISPKWAVFQAGGNDITGGTPWGTVETNLSQIHAALTNNGIRMIVCEITPHTPYTTEQKLLTRTWNTNIATWAASRSVALVSIFTPMGDPTNTDNLLPAYDSGDGRHLNSAGMDAWANLVLTRLRQLEYSYPVGRARGARMETVRLPR